MLAGMAKYMNTIIKSQLIPVTNFYVKSFHYYTPYPSNHGTTTARGKLKQHITNK